MGAIKTAYLVGFNLVSCGLWGFILFKGVQFAFIDQPQQPPSAYWQEVGNVLFLVQHLALMEIVHSLLGLVSSPVITVMIQVISRLYVVDLFTYPAKTCHADFSLYLMVLSWACVEVPRYSFYAMQLLVGEKNVPYPLFFLRYSLFMVLYPTGISGEILQQIASYPYWNDEKQGNQPWIARLSHIVIGMLYVPLGPFMIWNMFQMRKRASKKRAELLRGPAPLKGLIWPVTNTTSGERSTTDTAKKIFAAAARGAGKGSDRSEMVAKQVEKERNWRFGYTKHMIQHVQLCCESSQVCVDVAQAGLDATYTLFKFSEDGKKEITFAEALTKKTQKKFFSGHLKGGLADEKYVHNLSVPYKNQNLSGQQLVQQLDDWTQKGTIESSAAESIKACASKASEWMNLSDVLFIMLGATSAMGPLDNLLAHGATVVCIDLKRPQLWQGLFKRVQQSRGTIIYPLDSEGLESEKDKVDHAGCDMLQDTMAICDWLDKIVEEYQTKRVVCGNYTYLDGALHVQLALAGDAIMKRLCEKRKDIMLAFLCTPTDDHVIPSEAREYAKRAIRKASGWQKLLESIGVLKPNFAIPPVNGLCIVEGIVGRQGPNYALAKRLQHWRAIIARSQGHKVSSNVAPSTATQSVISNPQFAAGYFGWRYFPPLEVFLQDTSGSVMFALMVNDLRNDLSKANSFVGLPHPLNLFTEQSFHGGIWRCAYTIDSVGVPAALTFYVQRYGAVAVGALAVVGGAISYVIKGKLALV